MSSPRRFGVVVSGSMTRGVDVKLDGAVSVEDIAVGSYVTIEGEHLHFLGMVTEVSLEMADQGLTFSPPDVSDPFMSEVIKGTSAYGLLHVLPQLVIGGSAVTLLEGPQPAKTVPSHFALVREASARDIELAFGQEDDKHLYIGTPLDMETKVCLDLKRFVERSNGVFGKSGTGKTFLTRILLTELVQRGAAANLVFDMHNEYGWEGTSERDRKVKALKQLFPSKVAVFTLDEQSSRARGVSTDYVVEIGYDEIEPGDVASLQETLALTERAVDLVYELGELYGKRWLETFFGKSDRDVQKDLQERFEASLSTVQALRRAVSPLRRMAFLVPQARESSVPHLLAYLDRKINVVLEFGRYRDNIQAYVLVANLLTRRIYERYVARKEQAMGDKASEPTPLMITIEEAHKFLSSGIGQQTIFGTIAREMRKYNVTLLVIDQRPSSIDEEVMSQMGTKISCLLDNEKDVESVLTGTSGKSDLKGVLAKLDSKQQALVFGHAVPMPVVVKVKDYGSAESYRHFGFVDAAELKRRTEKDAQELWP